MNVCDNKNNWSTDKALMKTSAIIIAAIFSFTVLSKAQAANVNYAIGFYGGLAPSLGNDLQSYRQYYQYGSQSGVNGINRTQDDYETTNIDSLLGLGWGISFKVLLFENYQIRLAANYVRGMWGGEGTTLYGGAPNVLDCDYSFRMYDVPLTFGISIPFWKDVKISFNCGVAFAYGWYQNRFTENFTTTYKGKFTGRAYPLVILLEAEYFFTSKIAVTSSLSYYRGATTLVEDTCDDDGNVDYARLNFTGYRFNLGAIYYFISI